MLLGTPVLSEKALACGLVCDMFRDGEVLEKTIDSAAHLASQGGVAVRSAKKAMSQRLLTCWSHPSIVHEANRSTDCS
jgi:enoyl-CoA hydratase/carnithine racemase